MENLIVNPKLILFIFFVPLFLISITFHEYAHAFMAYMFGDDTAKKVGRMTFNPIKHLDLIGSVLIPIAAFASGIALIGWAKPVPVNPDNFSNKRWGDGIVSLAGPLSNLILAFLFYTLILFLPEISFFEINDKQFLLSTILLYGVYLNIFLFCFNLLPIPPLDGIHILHAIFYSKFTQRLVNFGLAGSVLLILFIYSPLWKYFNRLINTIMKLFLSLS